MVIDREKKAIVYKGTNYTYTELLQHSSQYLEYFKKLGALPKKVLIFSENSPEYIFTIYATLRAGAIVVPVDVTSTQKELTYMVNDCRPDIIMVSSEKREFLIDSIKSIENYDVPVIAFEDIDVAGVDKIAITPIPMGDDNTTVAIIYTSGTTGSPKGVMLSYKNIWYNMDAVINQLPIYNEQSNVILLLPLHHVFPFVGCVLAPLLAGATVYITENIAPETILRTLKEGKITIMVGVPRLYEALAKGIMAKINASFATKIIYKLASLIGSTRLSKTIFKAVHEKFGGHIEFLVSGGAALPIEIGKVFKTLGLHVLEGYGMTECAPMIAFTRPGEIKVGFCGRILPGAEVRIEPSGELCVKGPNVMQGYYNRPEETAQIIRDEWLYTGDTGIVDEKYGVKITGRIKEIIVTSNGKNINPAEIENEISQTSAAIKEIAIFLHDDILQAVVYPDMYFVRGNTGMTIEESIRPEIEAYNKAAMSYKRIKRFHITSLELPKTRLGKIQRFKLSEYINFDNRKKESEDISDRGEVFTQLKALIDNETGTDARSSDHFEIDLAMDSLGRVSLLASIEDKFGVVISESEFDSFSNLNLLSAHVETNYSQSKSITAVSWQEIFESSTPNIDMPHSGLIHKIIFMMTKVAFHLFYRYKSSGIDNIPNAPCIYVSNHRSGFDGVFITSKLRWKAVKRTFFFAKDKHFQGNFAKFMAKRNNVIVMDINSNVRSSMEQMYQVLKMGNSIIIFPEGTRSKDGKLKEFKESFAILSQSLNIPIVPIAIDGAEYATYNSIRLPRFLTKVKVSFLPSIRPSTKQSVKELRDHVKSVIQDALIQKK